MSGVRADRRLARHTGSEQGPQDCESSRSLGATRLLHYLSITVSYRILLGGGMCFFFERGGDSKHPARGDLGACNCTEIESAGFWQLS